jgi:hypothetical protein
MPLKLVSVLGALAVFLVQITTSAAHPVGPRHPALAPNAIVAGYVQVCGGPAPGRCRIGSVTLCAPHARCLSTDRVAAVNSRGRRVAVQRLVHGRFRLTLKPGRYTIQLLAGGPRTPGRVMQSHRVAARNGHTATVPFRFLFP